MGQHNKMIVERRYLAVHITGNIWEREFGRAVRSAQFLIRIWTQLKHPKPPILPLTSGRDLSRRVVTIREPADEREDLAVAAVVCDSCQLELSHMSSQLDSQKQTNSHLESKRRRLEIEVAKLKLQKRKIWN